MLAASQDKDLINSIWLTFCCPNSAKKLVMTWTFESAWGPFRLQSMESERAELCTLARNCKVHSQDDSMKLPVSSVFGPTEDTLL